MTADRTVSSHGRVPASWIGVALAALGVACGDAGDGGGTRSGGEERRAFVGTYSATEWLFRTEEASTWNLLAHGGGLTLTLHADGTTSGTATIPARFADADTTVQESLVGSWTVANDTVRFSDLQGEIFLDGGQLAGSRNGQVLEGVIHLVSVTLEQDDEGS